MRRNARNRSRGTGEIAYLLGAFPRVSETFIASEIHRLECAGARLRLYTMMDVESWEAEPRHPVVDRIRSVPQRLPALTSTRGTSATRWLAENARTYWRPLARFALRHPVRLARVATTVLVQGVRTRRSGFPEPARKHAKEFVRAVLLADVLRAVPSVRHLHAHYCHGTATVAWLAARLCGLSYSFTAHARDIYCEQLNPAGLLRRKLRDARFAVTCTEANRRHLQSVAGRGAPDIHRIYHGLSTDIATLASLAPIRLAAPERLRALAVGRLVPKKGFDTLIEAVAILLERGVDAELAIAGPDAGELNALQSLVQRRHLSPAIHFLGPVAPSALVGELRRASMFCLPCRVASDGDRDGIPNVLVEAMACGVPVITTPVSGVPELVEDGVNGLLVPPDTPRALAAAMQRLHGDPALAERLGHAGRTTVRARFDGDVLTRQLVSLFAAVA